MIFLLVEFGGWGKFCCRSSLKAIWSGFHLLTYSKNFTSELNPNTFETPGKKSSSKLHKNLHFKTESKQSPIQTQKLIIRQVFPISQSAIIECLTLKHSHHSFSQTRPIYFHSPGISLYPFLIQNVDLHTCPSPIKVETCCTCTLVMVKNIKIAAIANKLKEHSTISRKWIKLFYLLRMSTHNLIYLWRGKQNVFNRVQFTKGNAH